ncbi:MAG: type II toxin-antitoxin system VapB family antitoxin [Verrucomicrobiota bacterium]
MDYSDMRITVDIEESVLDELAKMTGETKMSPAVNRAVTDFVKKQKAKEFGKLLREGAFDFPMTNDELEKLGN